MLNVPHSYRQLELLVRLIFKLVNCTRIKIKIFAITLPL
jgi:hypothetical protein